MSLSHALDHLPYSKESPLHAFWAINAEHLRVGGDLRVADGNVTKCGSSDTEEKVKNRGISPIILGKFILHYSKIAGSLDMRGFEKTKETRILDAMELLKKAVYRDSTTVGEETPSERKKYRRFYELHLEHGFAQTLRADEFLPAGGRGPEGKGGLKIDGFRYESLHREFLQTDTEPSANPKDKPELWEQWLDQRSQEHFRAQPYRQLASLLAETGRQDLAEDVAIKMHRDHTQTITRPKFGDGNLRNDITLVSFVSGFIILTLLLKFSVFIYALILYILHRSSVSSTVKASEFPTVSEVRSEEANGWFSYVGQKYIGPFLDFGYSPLAKPLFMVAFLYCITVWGSVFYTGLGYLYPTMDYTDEKTVQAWRGFDSSKIWVSEEETRSITNVNGNICVCKFISYAFPMLFSSDWHFQFFDPPMEKQAPEPSFKAASKTPMPHNLFDVEPTIPPFNPWVYSADVFFPIIDLNTADAWHFNDRVSISSRNYKDLKEKSDFSLTWLVPHPSFFFGFMSVSGWVLATLILAGLGLRLKTLV